MHCSWDIPLSRGCCLASPCTLSNWCCWPDLWDDGMECVAHSENLFPFCFFNLCRWQRKGSDGKRLTCHQWLRVLDIFFHTRVRIRLSNTCIGSKPVGSLPSNGNEECKANSDPEFRSDAPPGYVLPSVVSSRRRSRHAGRCSITF